MIPLIGIGGMAFYDRNNSNRDSHFDGFNGFIGSYFAFESLYHLANP